MNFKPYEQLGIGEISNSTINRARINNSLEFVAARRTNVKLESAKDRIHHCVKMMNALQHPNILKFITWFHLGDDIWIITELCQNYTLEKMIIKDDFVPLRTILEFAKDIRSALIFMHQKSILHNDIHPSNILLTNNGIMKIIEFACSCTTKNSQISTRDQISDQVRKTGFLHRAPETLLENGAFSVQSDIYQFGQLIYFMLFKRFCYQDLCKTIDKNALQDDGIIQEYALNILGQGVQTLQQQLPPSDYVGQKIPEQILNLLYKMLYPLPFLRITWEAKEWDAIEVDSENVKISNNNYVNMVNAFAQNQYFGDFYSHMKMGKHQEISGIQVPKISRDRHAVVPTSQKEDVKSTNLIVQKPKEVLSLSPIQEQSNQYYKLFNPVFDLPKLNAELLHSNFGCQLNNIFSNKNKNLYVQQSLLNFESGNQQPQQIAILLKEKPTNFITGFELFLKTTSQNLIVISDVHAIQLLDIMTEIFKGSFAFLTQSENSSVYQTSEFQRDHFEKISSLIVNFMFLYRSTLLNLMTQQPLAALRFLIDFIVEQFDGLAFYHRQIQSYCLFAEILLLFITGVMKQQLNFQQLITQYQFNLTEQLTSFIQTTNLQLTQCQIDQTMSKKIIQRLFSQAISFYQFCVNMNTLYLENYKQDEFYDVVQKMNYSGLLHCALEIFIANNQDEYVSFIKQLGGTVVKLHEQLLFRASVCFVVMTDLKFSKYIDMVQIIPTYFDFTRCFNNVPALKHILLAISQMLLVEYYEKVDIDINQFIKNRTHTRKTENFVIQNMVNLFGIMKQIQDMSIYPYICLLLAALIWTDDTLELIAKNPLNIQSHKLIRFVSMEDIQFALQIETLVTSCNKKQYSFLVDCVSALVVSIKVFLDVCMFATHAFGIQDAIINIQHYEKCQECIQIYNRLFKPPFAVFLLFVSERQVFYLENTLFALTNTLFHLKPTSKQEIQDFELKKKKYDEEKRVYDELLAQHKGRGKEKLVAPQFPVYEMDQSNILPSLTDNFYNFVCSFIDLVCLFLNTPWLETIQSKLFYQNEEMKYRGLWYGFMSLMKDPHGFAQLQQKESREAHLNIAIKLFTNLKQNTLSKILISFERHAIKGPCGKYIQQNAMFQSQGDSYIVVNDGLELGLLVGTIFSQQQVDTAQNTLEIALTRIIGSKSMFQEIFEAKDSQAIIAAFNLIIFGLETQFISQDDLQFGLNQALKCVQQTDRQYQQQVQRTAYEVLEQIVAKNINFFQQLTQDQQLFESFVQNYELSFACLGQYISIVYDSLQKKILNQQDPYTDLLKSVKFTKLMISNGFKIGFFLTQFCQKCADYFASPTYASQQNIKTLTQLILRFLQIYLQPVPDYDYQGVLMLIKTFTDCSPMFGTQYGEQVISTVLDIITQCVEYFSQLPDVDLHGIVAQLQMVYQQGVIRFKIDNILLVGPRVAWPHECASYLFTNNVRYDSAAPPARGVDHQGPHPGRDPVHKQRRAEHCAVHRPHTARAGRAARIDREALLRGHRQRLRGRVRERLLRGARAEEAAAPKAQGLLRRGLPARERHHRNQGLRGGVADQARLPGDRHGAQLRPHESWAVLGSAQRHPAGRRGRSQKRCDTKGDHRGHLPRSGRTHCGRLPACACGQGRLRQDLHRDAQERRREGRTRFADASHRRPVRGQSSGRRPRQRRRSEDDPGRRHQDRDFRRRRYRCRRGAQGRLLIFISF